MYESSLIHAGWNLRLSPSKSTLKVYFTALARYILYRGLNFDLQLLKLKKDISSAS